MTEILDFLAEFEIWFYIILGLISLIFFSRLFKSIGDWREAAFGLEREIAQRRFRSSLSILVLLFILFVGEFFFVTYSSSLMPDQTNLATPTIDILASPSPTTITMVVEEESENLSPTAITDQEGCIPGKIEWIYEYTEPGNTIWKTIAGGNTVKKEEQIGLWNTSQIVPGDYLLRLVVLDNVNNEYPACIVSVRVINP